MSSSQSNPLPPRGMPILSGPPPITESPNCRQCTKPFNPFLRRAHACGHCGYEYCSTCLSDGQALMPRKTGQAGPSSAGRNGSSSSGASAFFSDLKEGFREVVGMDEPSAPGYEVEKVCLPCLGMLQVTSAPLPVLRSLPLKRLKEYLSAYNISLIGPKEKEDFVQAVVKARNPSTGCLSQEAESYYRRKSVPRAGQSSTTQSQSQARPPQSQPSPRPPPPQARPPPPAQSRHPPPHTHYAPRPQPTPPRPSAPAARAAPPPKAKTPPPPVPTILSLVSLPKSYLASLSIGTLKAILYENHVRVDFKQVLEKEELINRVHELILDERKRLERQRIEEERISNPAPVTVHLQPLEGEISVGEADMDDGGDTKEVPTGPMPEVERGLCVVCQDEEATLAVVDCGHLAMCAHCSDLIMATSQECPLCRTRIVTPQRLIRIYRV